MNASSGDLLTAELVVLEKNQIEVQGALNFETVPALMKRAETILCDIDEAEFSFKGVGDSNSAGLAFLLEIKRHMNAKNKTVIFSDLPGQIRTIAHAYGIDVELGTYLGLQD